MLTSVRLRRTRNVEITYLVQNIDTGSTTREPNHFMGACKEYRPRPMLLEILKTVRRRGADSANIRRIFAIPLFPPARTDSHHKEIVRPQTGYGFTACCITMRITSQVFSISASVNVGCTKNIKLVSPSSFAMGRRTSGRHPVSSNAFSR